MASQTITTDTFDQVISSAQKPVLVDFWASWCGPCRALGPTVEKISESMADKIDVYKCNVDENGDLAMRYGVMSIPTLILFKGGEVAHTIVGAAPEGVLVNEIEANL